MAQQQANEQNLYTFSGVALTLDGTQYNVASVIIALTESGIPEVTLTVDPAHALGDPAAPAVSSTFALIKTLNDKFQLAAVKRSKATFSMTVQSTGADNYTLTLKDWLCTTAGFGTVSTAGIGLRLTISHPVVVLNGTSTVLGNIVGYTSASYGQVTNATDIIDIFSKILQQYANTTRQNKPTTTDAVCYAGDMPQSNEVFNFILTQVRNISDALPRTLVWYQSPGTTSRWPFDYCNPELTPYIRYAMVDEMFDGTAFNMWDLLTQRICPNFLLSLVPTYTQDQLRVQPAGYWADPQLTVNEYEIESMSLPPVDPQPTIGVMLSAAMRSSQGGEESFPDQLSHQLAAYAMIPYIPQMFLNDPTIFGRLVLGNPATWFERAWWHAQHPKTNALTGISKDGPATVNGESGFPATGTASQFNEDKKKAMLRAYARALFQLTFRRGMQTRLTTRLMIKNESSGLPDKIVAPGVVCRVMTAQGKLFYDFYATHVVHVIDVQNNNAHSEIAGMFVRGEGQFGGIVRTGVPNVMYALAAAEEDKGALSDAQAEANAKNAAGLSGSSGTDPDQLPEDANEHPAAPDTTAGEDQQVGVAPTTSPEDAQAEGGMGYGASADTPETLIQRPPESEANDTLLGAITAMASLGLPTSLYDDYDEKNALPDNAITRAAIAAAAADLDLQIQWTQYITDRLILASEEASAGRAADYSDQHPDNAQAQKDYKAALAALRVHSIKHFDDGISLAVVMGDVVRKYMAPVPYRTPPPAPTTLPAAPTTASEPSQSEPRRT